MARTRKDLPKSQDGCCTSCGQKLPLQEKDPNANAATPVKTSEKTKNQQASPQDLVPPPSAQKQGKTSRKSSSPKASTKNMDNTDGNTTAASLSTIYLDGEESETVPIYATCDDIRKQINAHLPFTNKAAFSRELSELLPTSKVTPRNLDALLKMKGPSAGAHNNAFYAAYVFFEKIRIRDGKEKSAKRQKLEEIYGAKGYSRKGQHQMGIFCPAGVKPWLDQYGQWQMKGAPTGRGIIRKRL